jgi:hypothetical protein
MDSPTPARRPDVHTDPGPLPLALLVLGVCLLGCLLGWLVVAGGC